MSSESSNLVRVFLPGALLLLLDSTQPTESMPTKSCQTASLVELMDICRREITGALVLISMPLAD
jgi:hypothetical protein